VSTLTVPEANAPVRRPSVRSAAPFVTASAFYGAFIFRASGMVGGQRAFPLIDDAMISMTYARNLARGDGLVWNAGGPRVEGITNGLWAIIMAVPHWLGASDATAALFIALLGAGLLLVCGALAGAIVRRLAPDAAGAPTAATWLVLFCYPLVFWTLRGMEVGFLTALLLGAILLLLRLAERVDAVDLWLLAAVLVAGLLTRVDFAVFVVPLLVFAARSVPASTRRTVVVTIVASSALAILGQELARYAYYGAWMPNTYTLKLAHTDALVRFDRGLRSVLFTFLFSAAAAVVFSAVAFWHRRTAGLFLLGGCGAMAVLYNVYVGGDAWEWMRYANRMLTPGLVLLLCLGAIGVCDFVQLVDRKTLTRTVVVVLGVVAVLVLLRIDPGNDLLLRHPRVAERAGLREAPLMMLLLVVAVVAGLSIARTPARRALLLFAGVGLAMNFAPMGAWLSDGEYGTETTLARAGVELASITTPHARIAVAAAGNPIYYAHRVGIDLLGKSDRRIAEGPVHDETGFFPGHMKWNYAFSIVEDRPDVVDNLWVNGCADRQLYVDNGYVEAWPPVSTVGRGPDDPYLVRAGSPHVRWDRLVTRSAEESAAHLLDGC
jgi:hypothetical protein